MPRPCHPRTCRSSQGHGTAWPPRDALWANCQSSASYGYHAEFHEVNQTHTNLRCRWPVWSQTPFVMEEGKSGSSTQQKRRSVTLWTSSSDISGHHADIHEMFLTRWHALPGGTCLAATTVVSWTFALSFMLTLSPNWRFYYSDHPTGWTIWVRIPTWARGFSPKHPDRLWDPIGTGYFPESTADGSWSR